MAVLGDLGQLDAAAEACDVLVRASASLSNVGSARIAGPTVQTATNPALQTPVSLVFNNPPTTYQVNGVGALIPYTSGNNIDVNGWRVQISGTPVAGDTFRVDPNTNAGGDNRNGLLLLDLRNVAVLDRNTATYQGSFSSLLGQVGSLNQQAEISRDALKVQLATAEASRDEVAGVNLDEEAADLVRYQQAYQGAAQIISAADQAFQALLAALQR
jgi:flagellar hook-associated protein 1 FlgK